MATKKAAGKKQGGGPEGLDKAVTAAIGGETKKLYALLKKSGGTDRGEADVSLAQSVARALAEHGADADELVEEMAAMDEIDAEEGSAAEFIPFCGLYAHGERAARDASAIDAAIAALERTAQDIRPILFAAADAAMTRMGAGQGPKLLVERFSKYLATADIDSFVLTALSRAAWLDTFPTAEPVIAKLDQCFTHLAKAPPGFDDLPSAQRMITVLAAAPAAIAGRFPEAIAAFLEKWSADAGERIPPLVAANRKALAARAG